MKTCSSLFVLLSAWLLCACSSTPAYFLPEKQNALRAPAYPLVTIDPYTSAWSFADRLYEDPVRHWTGEKCPLVGALRVDGQTYRFMGAEEALQEGENGKTFRVAAVQKSANVLPTQTFYTFACGAVQLDLIFTAPLLMDNLELMSTPVNYISYQVKSMDGKPHDVQLYLSATPAWAVNTPEQPTEVYKELKNNVTYLKAGTIEQPVLQKKGDNVRIDWGYFYLAAHSAEHTSLDTGEAYALRNAFIENGDVATAKASMGASMALAYSASLGKVSAARSGYVMIGYDDLYSIQYFNDNRMPYWKQDGKVDIYQAFEKADATYDNVMQRCRQFDTQMMDEAEKAGGKAYADLCALAYRQAIAAHKLVEDTEGNLLFLSKENFSNGSIGTVDITYPSSPLFLLYNPDLLKGMMTPIFYFSESGRWNKPFPAHDVGSYPLANGQTYGGDMPVEESGNMLILATAIALVEGNPDYAKKHWQVLTVWADYLLKEGLDPENQLCTDDFAGHFAHNTNLSIKAILGIAGYGKLAWMMGETLTAEKYTSAAREMAQKWTSMADDGDHYRLTFDQPGTWSQKYNLVWDEMLGLDVFPKETAGREVAYYMTRQQKYGLPLDSRKTYTKADWILWSACLTNDPAQFRALIAPVHQYADETTTRMPFSDWYEATDGKSMNFRARSVVGGFFMKMLKDKQEKQRN